MVFLGNIDLSQNQLMNCVLHPLGTPPSAPRLGQIYCNTTTGKIMWYTGTKWQTVGVVVENSETNGSVILDGVEMTVYNLPMASETRLGGVRVGIGLSIDSNGVLSTTGGGEADSVQWNNVINKPTKLSSFTNDEHFIDNTISNLVNYYNKTEIGDLISLIPKFEIKKVTELPTTDISQSTIYLIPKSENETNNAHEEWIYTDTGWEKIGDTAIDLANYIEVNGGDVTGTTSNFILLDGEPNSGEYLGSILGKIIKTVGSLKENMSQIVSLKTVSETLASSPQTFPVNGKVVNVNSVNSTTNEAVIVDYRISPNGNKENVIVSITEMPVNPISIRIAYIEAVG